MPDRMPNRIPEDMSDRMPQDLPVRKCINVMVGITRSKVIFFQGSWVASMERCPMSTENTRPQHFQHLLGQIFWAKWQPRTPPSMSCMCEISAPWTRRWMPSGRANIWPSNRCTGTFGWLLCVKTPLVLMVLCWTLLKQKSLVSRQIIK